MLGRCLQRVYAPPTQKSSLAIDPLSRGPLEGEASAAPVVQPANLSAIVGAVTETCPRCGKSDVHHSRPRSPLERLRTVLTCRVPFRCHDCQWRGWRQERPPADVAAPQAVRRTLTESELEDLELKPRGELTS